MKRSIAGALFIGLAVLCGACSGEKGPRIDTSKNPGFEGKYLAPPAPPGGGARPAPTTQAAGGDPSSDKQKPPTGGDKPQ